MNHRIAELLATTNYSSSGTKVIDINVKDPISRIMVIMEVTNTSYTPTNHPLACLPLIEIVDGSEVLASMSGYAAQAMHFYNTGKIDHNELNYENVAVCRAAVSLDFGRYLWDELFAFDPTKYRNPQLRIKHDYSLGGCSPASINLRVIAAMFDEKSITPEGFMLAKEVFGFTPVAGAAEYVELPLSETIRKLMIMNVNDSEEPDVEFETIKLDEDEGKRIIVNAKTMDIIRLYECMYPRFSEYLSGRAGTTAINVYLSHCKDIQFAGIGNTTAAASMNGAWSGGRKRAIEMSATVDFGAIVTGRCPHGAVPILLGKQDDPNDWWDVSRVGKAQLIITPRATPAINTAKTTDIIVQQVKRY